YFLFIYPTTTQIYSLSLHDALPISLGFQPEHREFSAHLTLGRVKFPRPDAALTRALDSIKKDAFGAMRVEAIHLFQSQLHPQGRSEEHTSELQSRSDLVCRLLLEKK